MDVINGDQSAFLRADEIELAWKIIAQVQALGKTVLPYKKGSAGPKAF
jgi:glucose-6-phosphate 1-dehydrogenase